MLKGVSDLKLDHPVALLQHRVVLGNDLVHHQLGWFKAQGRHEQSSGGRCLG